jgi:hypothetical protein
MNSNFRYLWFKKVDAGKISLLKTNLNLLRNDSIKTFRRISIV